MTSRLHIFRARSILWAFCGPQVDTLIYKRGLECPNLFNKLWLTLTFVLIGNSFLRKNQGCEVSLSYLAYNLRVIGALVHRKPTRSLIHYENVIGIRTCTLSLCCWFEAFKVTRFMSSCICNSRSSYSSCIRTQAGYCCIEYQVCNDVTNGFTIDQTAAIGIADSKCTLDYVGIEGW